jgi:hypothetical protein
MQKITDEFCQVNGRPFIKNPLSFFESSKQVRLMLTVTDNDSWKDDIVLAEKMFGILLVSSFSDGGDFQVCKDVLKQRMKYPGIQENPELLKLAKVWILPNKLFETSNPDNLLNSYKTVLTQSAELIKTSTDRISFVKFELSNGKERMHIYKLLDEGYRPSLLCVKWSYDLEEDFSTANCAGHLVNIGYVHIALENGYSLYYYTDNCVYDVVSWKDVYYGNPLVQDILNSCNNVSEEEPATEAPATE